MTIIVKNKQTLLYKDFIFKCCIGKNGFTRNKIEGDGKTPSGLFKIENLYFREDRLKKPKTKIKCIRIKRSMGWCNDIKKEKIYNKLITRRKNVRNEKLFRKDYKYNLLLPIKYNWHNPKVPKGSAIFIHITKNYKPTAGCIGLSYKDLLILIRLINRKTKIKIR